MKLPEGDRSILATFTSWNVAEGALQDLKQAGFDVVQLDRVTRYGHNENAEYNDPVRGQAATLSGLTQLSGNEFAAGNAGPLIAADPAASGMSGEMVDEQGVLLTTVVADDRVQEAVGIIEQHGGRV